MSGLKDITYPLRKGYRAKLEGITYNGIPIVVYDGFVPENAADYFIVLKDQTEGDKGYKGTHNTEAHVTLDIVTRFAPGFGTSKACDDIAGLVQLLIVPMDSADLIDLTPDFKVMNSIRTMSRPIYEESATERIVRRILIFKHEIQQLN